MQYKVGYTIKKGSRSDEQKADNCYYNENLKPANFQDSTNLDLKPSQQYSKYINSKSLCHLIIIYVIFSPGSLYFGKKYIF